MQESSTGDSNTTGYTAFHKTRKEGRDGGAALYIRDTIQVHTVDVPVPDNLGCLWLRATPTHCMPKKCQPSSLQLSTIHQRPRTHKELNDHISYTVANMQTKHPHRGVLICGNFTRAVITHLCSRRVKQVVKYLTRGNVVPHPEAAVCLLAREVFSQEVLEKLRQLSGYQCKQLFTASRMARVD